MKLQILLFALVLLAVLTPGCESDSQSRRREAINRGMTELLARHGVSNSPSCGAGPITESSGSVPCKFQAQTEQVLALERRLKLQVVDPDQSPQEEIARIKDHYCQAYIEFNLEEQRNKLKIYKSVMHAPELRLNDGIKFEYLFLYHNTQSNSVCAQVFYNSEH